MKILDLTKHMSVHEWRLRFAFLPTKRIVLENGYISESGKYWWRLVFEVKVGLAPVWTAYAHMNDDLETTNTIEVGR